MEQFNDKIQILVATMFQTDFSKVEEMNISSDVLFANQADKTCFEEKSFGSFKAQMLTTDTRGVGLNRNLALLNAKGDILLISDDDMVYSDGYEEMIKKAFSMYPDADAFIFNINTVGADVKRRINTKYSRVRWNNALNYGAARIAVRKNSLVRDGIFFSTCFGGGTGYSAGEDSLFICDMLKRGFKIYTSPDFIATVDQSTSTWFNGYNQKYLYDKGAFYGAAFHSVAPLLCLQDLVRHKRIYKDAELSFMQAFKLMNKGGNGYKKLQVWKDSIQENERIKK